MIHSVNQGHSLTTVMLFGVYTQPIKGVYCLASCYNGTLNPTLNLGEGQTFSIQERQVVCCGWFGRNKLEITGLFTEHPHKIDNTLLNKAP